MNARILALAFLVVFGGCKASTGQVGKGSLKTDLAPNLADYTVKRVAILGSANVTGNTDAEAMPMYVTQALKASGKYYFASTEEFAGDAKNMGLQSEHRTLRETWEKRRTVDPKVLGKILGGTHYDALVAMEVTDWNEYQIDASQEGSSSTTIGLGIRMFAPDGTSLWRASDLRTVESGPYLPDFNVRSTEGGEARPTSQAAVPEPPRIEVVAPMLAKDLVATMPQIGGSDAGQKD